MGASADRASATARRDAIDRVVELAKAARWARPGVKNRNEHGKVGSAYPRSTPRKCST